MRHSFGQFMLTMLLAAIILAGGWLGICNLGLFLPSGTDGYALHDMAELNEENFIATLSAVPLSPFTDSGFPEEADLLDIDSAEYRQYYEMLSDLTGESMILNTLINLVGDSLPDIYESDGKALYPSNAQVEAQEKKLATYSDDRGIWLMVQISAHTTAGSYHMQLGLHSRDGFRIFRITQNSATHVQLSPGSTLLERATAACNEFMAFWQEYAVKPSDQGYNEYAMVLDGEGELIEYPVAIPVPLDISHPTKTELDGTRCHVYYPAEGGEIVMIYDFIGMHITGAAFIPEA